ncbi:hydroxyacid dehydrogenase [Rathayibacter sp. SD072]|uniref:hydroxyacid dehydrogenase n=1 Tax=Rathayibacter sp. SD072 TaxID=2781731 RepID=UPI001A978901|nr:hydroxyacid dehydrogenase [Rathayibacter sp. SD072]MBO0982622.1 hydroxyacid dehydrogenase [Rathayibacter sp. SD072]
MDKPLVILDPAPQLRDRIFTPAALERLHASFEVLDLEQDPREGALAEALPRAFAVIGQPDLPAEMLHIASKLRVIVNVEGNFLPNIDYPAAFRNGIRVLACGTAYSEAVAEYSLGLALDLARGISREDRALRRGEGRYVAEGNADAILLRKAPVGFVGFGNLGRAVLRLLAPFENTIRAYDPWLPTAVLEDAGLVPSTLDETLSESKFVFVFATATAENQGFLNARMLDLLPDGARLIAVSRANVLDYDALLERVAAGRLYAGIDVWPEEPIPVDSPFLRQEDVVLSGHRAGGIPEAFFSIGDMVCDDLELMKAGLPPVRLQSAAPELVSRYRNRPVTTHSRSE